MAAASWVLVDDLDAALGAAEQMATDVALLDWVLAGGAPVLRLYRWSPPALTLGRFQDEAEIDTAACARRGVEVVRRPTGGRALLHGADVTYAIAMPVPPGPAGHVEPLYRHVAGALVAGLARLGVRAEVARRRGEMDAVCFASQRGADLRVGDSKVCGSAQVRRDGVVLQHGAVLVDRLPFDETDLVTATSAASSEARAEAHARLRASTITLAELGAPTDPRTVADALVGGFASTLDVDFRLTVRSGVLGQASTSTSGATSGDGRPVTG